MSEAAEHAALADALLGWAREFGDDIWFTAEQAAAAVGVDAARVGEALADLEDAGLVWRSIVERRFTFDSGWPRGRCGGDGYT